jgi:chloramphenicol 3-O-phosphotransferase
MLSRDHRRVPVGVIVVTGVMASGKSTVAELLARRLDPSVHLRGDLFRRMIVNGRAEVRPDDPAAIAQLRLRHRLSAQAADTYAAAGFGVVVQDIILGPLLEEYVALVRARPLRVVVLAPSVAVVADRERARGKVGYGATWTPQRLDAVLREDTPRLGLWVDSSDDTADETVGEILARLDEAIVAT